MYTNKQAHGAYSMSLIGLMLCFVILQLQSHADNVLKNVFHYPVLLQ